MHQSEYDTYGRSQYDRNQCVNAYSQRALHPRIIAEPVWNVLYALIAHHSNRIVHWFFGDWLVSTPTIDTYTYNSTYL